MSPDSLPNRKLYKQTTESELADILSPRHALRYGNRLVYIKKKKVDLYGQDRYAYIGVDTDSRSWQLKRTVFVAIDDGLSPEAMDARISKLGVFMLLSSDDMGTEEVLPLYIPASR